MSITSSQGYTLCYSALYRVKEIFFLILLTNLPVIIVNFWIDIPHKSCLYMIYGMSLHLQKLMYLRLPRSEP